MVIYSTDLTIGPQLATKGKRFDQWITVRSPVFQKRAVGRLQRFMAHETGFRVEELDTMACWESDFEVLSITTDMYKSNTAEEESHVLVGFIWMILDQPDLPTLYNCYLHPSFRGERNQHNLMARSWKRLIKRFPKFEVEEPVSGSMRCEVDPIYWTSGLDRGISCEC